MSLKRRNMLAWIFILLSAISWATGKLFFHIPAQELDRLPQVTSVPGTDSSIEETVFPSPEAQETLPSSTLGGMLSNLSGGAIRTGRILFSMIAAAAAIISVFLLYPQRPLLGPDGVLILLALICAVMQKSAHPSSYGTAKDVIFCAWIVVLFLLCMRELWGWVRSKFPSGWYLINRTVKRIRQPQAALLYLGIWLAAFALAAFSSLFFRAYLSALLLFGGVIIAGFCLWQYGAGWQHFKLQLDHFQNDEPIEAKEGPMAGAEKQLLKVQIQHRDAVKTAVASERFKVDLISNVSHDLRTPLTAIVGYGELLQKETLSEEGTMQLTRLNQKARYMRELVDSLFELTKVSSGVLECKKEEIDLIRLLEQTIGLMDDQLSMAGLTVKRHYASETIPLITDGGRMHQVFANLLGNAIKYALPGTRIHLEAKEDNDSYMVRMVNTASYEMDFAPEEITQRFVRGDKARSTKGSGLGLAIAQTYTESVGGSFRVTVDGDQFGAIVHLPKSARNL